MLTDPHLEIDMASGWAMSVLPELERKVVQKRFFDVETPSFSAIGKELGCSRDRATMAFSRGLRKMRNYFCKHSNGEYAELLIDILREVGTERIPSRSRPSLPCGHKYVPITEPKQPRRVTHKSSPPEGLGFREVKRVPCTDGIQSRYLCGTHIMVGNGRKYVRFKSNKRFEIYKSLERKGWTRDSQGVYFNPKSGPLRSIVFRWDSNDDHFVWMDVCFARAF